MSDGPGPTQRPSVHSDKDLAASRSPIVAAWDAGRCFNELAFCLHQDWFLSGRQGQQQRATTAFEGFVIAACDVLTSVSAQNRLRDELCEWFDEWRDYIQSEHHVERLGQAQEDLENGPLSRHAAPLKAACKDLARTVDYEIKQLRKILDERLDERQLTASRLAEAIDQVVRPRQVYREMLAAAAAYCQTDNPEFPNRLLSAVNETARKPSRLQLREIAQGWNQLGLSVDELEPMTGVEPSLLAKRLFDAGRQTLLAADPEPEAAKEPRSAPGDAAGSENLESAPADPPPRRCRVPELLLYDRHWKVGREGCEAVRLTKLPWKLLAKLIREFDVPASYDMLCLAWQESPNDPKPEEGTVRDAVSDLSRKLRPLDFRIKNDRKLGWVLFDLRAAAISGEGNSAAQDA